MKRDIKETLGERILILDGAMGTMIQRHRLTEEQYRGQQFQLHPRSLKGNNDLLSVTQPKIIRDIHLAYLRSGADIISTNTFNGNRISMADYGMERYVYDINFAAAKLGREAVLEHFRETGKEAWVAGSVGPTNRTASMSPDVSDPGARTVTFSGLADAYAEQVRGLVDGGVDLLLVETVFDGLNAKAALFAISGVLEEKAINLPVMVSGTITDASGRTLTGQNSGGFPYHNVTLSASQHRSKLRTGGRTAQTFHRRIVRKSTLLCLCASERRTAQPVRRVRSGCGIHGQHYQQLHAERLG